MDSVISQILSAAGFAGALLIVMGWAYWKKDKSEKATQIALVKQAEEHGSQIKALQQEFITQLQALSEKRTDDAQQYATMLRTMTENQMRAVQEVAVTNTEVKAVLIEIRRDIRTRNRGRSITPGSFDPPGGE